MLLARVEPDVAVALCKPAAVPSAAQSCVGRGAAGRLQRVELLDEARSAESPQAAWKQSSTARLEQAELLLRPEPVLESPDGRAALARPEQLEERAL